MAKTKLFPVFYLGKEKPAIIGSWKLEVRSWKLQINSRSRLLPAKWKLEIGFTCECAEKTIC
jgi:hypothetical protein